MFWESATGSYVNSESLYSAVRVEVVRGVESGGCERHEEWKL